MERKVIVFARAERSLQTVPPPLYGDELEPSGLRKSLPSLQITTFVLFLFSFPSGQPPDVFAQGASGRRMPSVRKENASAYAGNCVRGARPYRVSRPADHRSASAI